MAATYRADHVGSLLRPAELLEARRSFRENRITAAQLREAEDDAILRALEVQRQAGVAVFTDGEYRRGSFLEPLSRGIEGLASSDEASSMPRGALAWQGPNASVANETMRDIGLNQVVGAKLRRVGRLTGAEGAFLKQHAPGPWKTTMPGPTMRLNVMFQPGLSDQYYKTVSDLRTEIVGFMQAEVRDLLAEGVSYLQLDSLLYIGAAGPNAGAAGPQALDEIIAADNAVIDVAKAGGATVGLHMCRGNNRSAWLSEGTYEHLEKAFNELRADRFLLEYDTGRSGGFEPLRFMPKDKIVVLGLISTKVPVLEPLDVVRRRIDEASKYIPMDNLAISPQCGFASSMLGNLVSWDDQRRKLELVVEAAKKVWG